MAKARSRPVTDQQVVDCYTEMKSIYKVSKRLGIGTSTIHRVLRKLRIEMYGLAESRKNRTRFIGRESEIRKLYDEGNTVASICEQVGGASYYSIRNAIRRAGGVLRDNPVPTLRAGELENIKRLHDLGMGQVEISLQLNRSQTFISRAMRSDGIRGHFPTGPSHPMWRGGRFKNGSGYVMVMAAESDPLAQAMKLKSGYVAEHRLIMARKMGRPLLSSETVHHVDSDRINNAPENLQLRQGKHGKNVAMRCLDCGSHRIGPTELL